MEDAPIVCDSSADSLPEMSDWEFLEEVPELPGDIDLQEDDPGHLGDSEIGDHRSESMNIAIDVGGRSSNMDDNIAVSNAFIDRNKQSGIVLPWENPMLAAIFGEVVPSPGMPSSWWQML